MSKSQGPTGHKVEPKITKLINYINSIYLYKEDERGGQDSPLQIPVQGSEILSLWGVGEEVGRPRGGGYPHHLWVSSWTGDRRLCNCKLPPGALVHSQDSGPFRPFTSSSSDFSKGISKASERGGVIVL